MNAISVKEQFEVIKSGAVQVIPEAEMVDKITASRSSGRPLRVKYGADPSAPDIHLGHTVPLQKLRQFQDLGHLVVFIIGDFTAQIGDPSGKTQTRPQLSQREVKENARTYQEQVFKILNRKQTEVVYNSAWLSRMNFADVIDLASRYTVARMLERDDFTKRYREGVPISVLEFLYPLMQGYDSVEVKADIEIGGTDQTFNLLLAREIQKSYGQPPQAILTLPLLEGIDGVQKMSKSLGNYIGISEAPEDIYGKIMSISDDLMWRYFEHCSKIAPARLMEIKTRCEAGASPMDYKKELALEITTRFHSPAAAAAAEKRFERVHQAKKTPERMEEVTISQKELTAGGVDLISMLRKAGLAESNSQARRKISEGAVRINNKKIIEHNSPIAVKDNDVLKLGKRRFRRIRIAER